MTRHETKLRVVTVSEEERLSPLAYEFESLVTSVNEFKPLFYECLKEVGGPRLRPAINLREMVHGELAGNIHVQGARTESGELVGFVVNMVGYPTKYGRMKHGHMDMMYLRPDWRRGFNAVNMLKENIAHLKRLGCRRITCGSPLRFKNKTGLRTSQLFKFLGFKPVEVAFDMFVED